MRAIHCCVLLGSLLTLTAHHNEALQCYTCIGSTHDDCNRQGSKTCPEHTEACTVVRGQGNGMMKSCSYKSFCSQANHARGVKVQCCYSNNCNVSDHATQLSGGVSYLLVTLLVLLCLLWN